MGVKTCHRPRCKTVLSGRQTKWCSQACKRQAWDEAHAGDLLASLPQEDFREVIRDACLRRDPGGGRLKLRFGEYHPNK